MVPKVKYLMILKENKKYKVFETVWNKKHIPHFFWFSGTANKGQLYKNKEESFISEKDTSN